MLDVDGHRLRGARRKFETGDQIEGRFQSGETDSKCRALARCPRLPL
jgi:hypothetical protein